jgi:AmmeMemoRadiSam system protein B
MHDNLLTDDDNVIGAMPVEFIWYTRFLARLLQGRPDVTLVPIMVGNLTTRREALYGELMAPYLKDHNNVFIISSDFCHWGSRFGFQRVEEWAHMPGSDGQDGTAGAQDSTSEDLPIHQRIERLDRQGMRLIERRHTAGFARYLQVCGRNGEGRHLH